MRPKEMMQKRLLNATVFTKRIISVFKKLKFMEKEGNNDNTFFLKHVDLLAELLENEKSLFEKMSKEEGFNEITYTIMNDPSQFQMTHGIKGQAFSRFFRNLFIYDENKNGEADINILNTMPEYSHLDFKATNNNYPQLFKAFSEDLFYTYIRLIDRNLQAAESKKSRLTLIDEKYKIYAINANTNQFYINSIKNGNNQIESKAATVLEELKLDERVYDFLVTDFAYNFCNEFFDNALAIEDRNFQKLVSKREGLLRLILLESVLALVPQTTIENLENMFYKKYYEINYNFDYQNKEASAAVVNVFHKLKKKSKVFVI